MCEQMAHQGLFIPTLREKYLLLFFEKLLEFQQLRKRQTLPTERTLRQTHKFTEKPQLQEERAKQ